MAITVDPARLYSLLLQTGLQNKDQITYQLLNQLIGQLATIATEVNGGSGSGGGGGSTTIINPTTILGPIEGVDNSEEAQLIQLLQSTEITGTGGDLIRGEIPTGSIDGSNKVFQTANNYVELAVYLNGVRQQVTLDYTLTTVDTFTFNGAPLPGDIVTVDYGAGGTIGPQGPPGNTGPTGTPGINGLNGVVGLDGQDGEEYFPIPGPPGRDGTTAGGFVKIYRATDQTIALNTETTLIWSNTIYDTESFFNAGDPTKLTIPTGVDGTYTIVLAPTLEVFNGTGVCELKLYRNGNIIAEASMVTTGFALVRPTPILTAQAALVAGDVLTATVYIEDSIAINHKVIGGSTLTTWAIGTMGGAGGSGGSSLTAGDGIDITSDVISVLPDGDTITVSPAGVRAVPQGWYPLDNRIFTGSSEEDFTSLITSDYDSYIIQLINVRPGTNDASIQMEFSTDNGMTWDTSSIYQFAYSWSNTGNGNAAGGGTGGTNIGIGNVNNNSGNGINGFFIIFAPLAAAVTEVEGRYGFLHSSIGWIRFLSTFWYNSATPVDAFRWKPSTGTFDGQIILYGVNGVVLS